MVRKILFICGRAKQRSLTAEEIFAGHPGITARAAGISKDADIPVTPELLEWADQILVMEKSQKTKLNLKFADHLAGKRIGVLGIADKYQFMDRLLVDKLRLSVLRYL